MLSSRRKKFTEILLFLDQPMGGNGDQSSAVTLLHVAGQLDRTGIPEFRNETEPHMSNVLNWLAIAILMILSASLYFCDDLLVGHLSVFVFRT